MSKSRRSFTAEFKREAVQMIQQQAVAEWIDSRLVLDALEMAVARHCPGEELMAHSDRGVQYASEYYQRLLKKHGITCSMRPHSVRFQTFAGSHHNSQ